MENNQFLKAVEDLDRVTAELAQANRQLAACAEQIEEQQQRLTAAERDASKYRWLMSDAILNGTLGIKDGWIDFEFKDITEEQIERAMLGDETTKPDNWLGVDFSQNNRGPGVQINGELKQAEGGGDD